MNSQEVFHLWANQARLSARSGNVSFSDRRLYSWATVVAQIFVNARGERLAVFTSQNHSVSTQKQLGYARRAWGYSRPQLSLDLGNGGSNGVHTLFQSDTGETRVTDSVWFNAWEHEMGARIAALVAPRSLRSSSAYSFRADSLRRELEHAKAFARFFDRAPLPETREGSEAWQRVNALREKAQQWEAKDAERSAARAKREEAARQKRLADALAKVDAWRRGEPVTLPHVDRIFLRLAPHDERGRAVVETSWGARVLLRDAVALYRLCALSRTSPKVAAVVQRQLGQIGPYPLNAIDPEGNATVGCHKLTFAEMKRLADEIGEERLAAALAEKGDA